MNEGSIDGGPLRRVWGTLRNYLILPDGAAAERSERCRLRGEVFNAHESITPWIGLLTLLPLVFAGYLVVVDGSGSVIFEPWFLEGYGLLAGTVMFYWLLLGPTLWVDATGVRNDRVYVRWNTVTRIYVQKVVGHTAWADGVIIERKGAGRSFTLVHTYGFSDSKALAAELERWWRAAVPEPACAVQSEAA